jgi:hypothetical protein
MYEETNCERLQSFKMYFQTSNSQTTCHVSNKHQHQRQIQLRIT